MKLILLLLSVTLVQSGKVLFYIPFSSKSVQMCYAPLLETLADRGHDVTVVMPFEASKDSKYKVINSDLKGVFSDTFAKATEPMLNNQESSNALNALYKMVNVFIGLHENAIKGNKFSNYVCEVDNDIGQFQMH